MSIDQRFVTISNVIRTILSDLQKLIHDKHKEVIDKLNELTAIVRGQEVVSAATEDVKYIEVPKEIAERFRDSTNRYLVGHEQRFPLRKGMDAFIRYFREVSIMFLPRQLLTEIRRKGRLASTLIDT